MKNILLASTLLVAGVLIAPSVMATPPVKVKIYSGFSPVNGGAPYSGLIGSFYTTEIDFATTTGYNWHPFFQDHFGADITGFIQIPRAGSYTFSLDSDDGSELYIDGNLVVDNGGVHGPNIVSNSATLTAGTHSFEVQFFEDFGGESGVDLKLPSGVKYGFAGTPRQANCVGKSVSQLAQQFRGIAHAAPRLGFSSVSALQNAIKAFCAG